MEKMMNAPMGPDVPRVAIQFEHPHEFHEWCNDQLNTLDIEIEQWTERLRRLQICRDSISQAKATVEDHLSRDQPVPGARIMQ